jgi:formate hydrogenlyase subunit 4
MIHEVRVLDHGGIEFGLITYAAALKLWLLGTLIISLFLPLITANPLGQLLAGLAGQLLLAAMVGGIESCMARLRLVRVPQMLVGAAALAALAFILVLR